MKNRKQIKDFRVVLKDFEGMVKDPKFLWSGRKIGNFSLLPREAWGNWLFCAVLRKIRGDEITFAEDDIGDGIILDEKTGQYILTEHVAAMDFPSRRKLPKGEARIIQAINHKIEKGLKYAKDKVLIVFFDGAGEWFRNKVRESINGRHGFHSIYAIGLLTSGDYGYNYSVTQFFEKDSISFKVHIKPDFTDWSVERMQ